MPPSIFTLPEKVFTWPLSVFILLLLVYPLLDHSVHRSHFGSRYKSGCCNFAGLLRRLLWAPGLLAQAAACLTNRTTACPGARSARTTACPDNNRAPRSAVAWRGHFLAVAVRGEIPRGCYCASQGEVLPRRHGRLANNFLPQPS